MSVIQSLIGGFPRIGADRELKQALEKYWSGQYTQVELVETGRQLRSRHWTIQSQAGLSVMAVNDFSFYDNMLDTAFMLGVIPDRFNAIVDPLDRYFAMARGTPSSHPLAMKKWFNTNYHFLVPEIDGHQTWRLNATKVIGELSEAMAAGHDAKVNLIGPLTFLRLSRQTEKLKKVADSLEHLPIVLGLYIELLDKISAISPTAIIQFDEPILVCDPDSALLAACATGYRQLGEAAKDLRILVNTYFSHAREALAVLVDAPIWGIGLDMIHGWENLDAIKQITQQRPDGWPAVHIVAGVVNGRNIWANDQSTSCEILREVATAIGPELVIVSSSCSLLHVPFSLERETSLPPRVKTRLAFASEKVVEIATLSRTWRDFPVNVAASLQKNPVTVSPEEAELIKPREPAFALRSALQKAALGLPTLPTTTIGSFPQTADIRSLRNKWRSGQFNQAEYETELFAAMETCIRFQEEIGLDVLVHGEYERTDMVEFFGEQLDGFAFTAFGWVQSYGSRCVKPPLIHGPVTRPRAMTVDLMRRAQSLTTKPLKGMLTGPVTILNWSFVREDTSRSQVCGEIAQALRQEILDLESAGIRIIQVDEAAFKEGYPLRRAERPAYERMAVNGFRLATGSVGPTTQIHSHMCYSEFGDIMATINDMDVDVLSIETTRDGNRLLEAFRDGSFDRELGPGIYDIHSPSIPPVEELSAAIRDRLAIIGPERLWINPDCGLKTRAWAEVEPSLRHMVQAAALVRQELNMTK